METSKNKILVPGRLYPAINDNQLAGADAIWDDHKGKNQQEINAETEALITATGGVFDVSEYNRDGNGVAMYRDLGEALDAVPVNVRKGGMSIKFIQSSVNKYVQYRLMSNAWSDVVADWQGVDDKPIAGSNNLVKSGGVHSSLLDTRRYLQEELNQAVESITPIEITGDVTNAPDEEDLTSVNISGTDVIRFKDKEYNKLLQTGFGRVYLRKNIVNGINTLTQSMMQAANTIYVIQYDYDLANATITIPANCVLQFEGGIIKNGVIIGNNTKIITIDFVQIFDGIILEGLFYNDHISVINFGVKYGTEDNATNNTNIINNYISPSCDNTKLTILFPKVLGVSSENTTLSYFINDTIYFTGKHNIDMKDYVYYVGELVNTAITVGNNTRSNSFKYRIIVRRYSVRSSQATVDNPVNSIGVKIINASSCEIAITSLYFIHSVQLIGDGTGFTYNRICLNEIGGGCYTGVTLLTVNSGWVNENLFIGGNGKFENYSNNIWKDTCIAFYLNAAEGGINNNMFLKPYYEGYYIGYKCTDNVKYNLSIGDRGEAVSKISEGANETNAFLITYKSNSETLKDIPNYLLCQQLIETKYKTIIDTPINKYILGNSNNAKSAVPLYIGDVTDFQLECYKRTNNPIYGVVLDVSVFKYFRVTTSVPTRLVIVILDDNYQRIDITKETKYTYFSNNIQIIYNIAVASSDANKWLLSFTNNASKVFVGLQQRATRFKLECISSDLVFPENVLLNPISKTLPTLPTTVENTEPGTIIQHENGTAMWNGTSWFEIS